MRAETTDAPHPPLERQQASTGERRRPARIVTLVLSRFIAFFLLFDGAARLARFTPYVEGLTAMGYPEWLGPSIGAVLLVATILYLIRATAVLGAVLVTGYLGGATASQVRLEDPWFLFPVVLGGLLWAHLWVTEPRLRTLFPVVQRRP